MPTITVTDEEFEDISMALAMNACFLETGTVHMSWDDAQRLGKDHWDQFDIRAPSTDQIIRAQRIRKLWARFLQRRWNDALPV